VRGQGRGVGGRGVVGGGGVGGRGRWLTHAVQ